jgi:excisionase family DNA binding protein
MIKDQGGFVGAANAAAAGAPAAPPPVPTAPQLLTPADAAKVLGVTEADVMASIEAGDLKAKKIGSAFRITQAALDQFLAQ